ncbi:4249_t:CDS:1 [Acaulospora colombiana]|uniref:4249_t:CDS:1 n=1 Tax=Acaulospora colombiana TaxID=27376 RepID=A0ACA9P7K8_9GLOM|nr:4249_t:CDS:1 [Acaulospora colombiana]
MPDPIQHRYQGSRTAAPSSSRQRDNQIQHRAQSLSYRQLLQQRLQKYGWSATFNVECTGPQHAQQWSGSFWIGGIKIGQSSWHSSKDAAKEEAAQHAMSWFNTQLGVLGHHERLQYRLTEYGWTSTLSVEWTGSPTARQWNATFWIGRIKIGQASSQDSESAAKEEAALRAIEWCQEYGYCGKQPSSYQELLQHRVQKYELTATFVRSYGEPMNGIRCRISYWIGRYKTGVSDWRDSEDTAREEAAQRSLVWLARNGYP